MKLVTRTKCRTIEHRPAQCHHHLRTGVLDSTQSTLNSRMSRMQNPGTRHRQHTNGVGAQHLHMLSLLQQRCSMKQVGLLLTAQTRVHMQSLLSLSLAQHITRRILRVETRWVLGPLPIPCALPKVNTALSRRMQTLELQEDQPLMDQRVHVGVEGVPAYHHAHHRHQ